MKIEIAIKNADFNQLNNISANAIPSYSFWGTRSIQAVGYEGKAPIDSLTSRVYELVKAKNFEYIKQERVIGKQIATNINRIYATSDKQIANSNLITRLICAFQSLQYYFKSNFFATIKPTKSPIRWTWDDNDIELYGLNHVFDHYTKRQYKIHYGNMNNYFFSYRWSNLVDLSWGDEFHS